MKPPHPKDTLLFGVRVILRHTKVIVNGGKIIGIGDREIKAWRPIGECLIEGRHVDVDVGKTDTAKYVLFEWR